MSTGCYLYIIECLANNKIYVGISTDPEKRWKRHKSEAKSKVKSKQRKSHLHNAINKYKEYQFTFSIIEYYCSFEEAQAAEREWIAYLKGMGQQLLNITDGGEGTLGSKRTKKQNQKMSKLMSGSNNPMYGKRFYGADNPNYGKPIKPHVQEILLQHRRKLTQEQVDNIRHLYEKENYGITQLSEVFGIVAAQISRIVHYQSWTGGKANRKPITKPNITVDQVKLIRKLYATGNYTYQQLSERFNLSNTQIRRIIKRERWKDI